MKYNQQNYKELASRFKVEELKERLEFNMAESAGWSKKTEVKSSKTTAEIAKIQAEVAGPYTSVSW